MTHSPAAVRLAQPEDRDKALASIVAAFIADPVNRYVMPTAPLYLDTMAKMMSHFGGAAFDHGSAWVVDDFAGAALWLPPGVHSDFEALGALMQERISADRRAHMRPVMEHMGEFHPTEPHWYLAVLGVDPHARGLGLGGALLAHSLERVDRDRLPAYLESSNPRNIPLYERHGFEVIGQINVPPVPVITPMIRRPR
jgi:ribosomal protein S18 acetylase RimI-like enzyme